ncbi:hypothetical protein B9Z55_026821 [Caenorhabditis nigoni]|uniref:F-box domain-containing protein n=1 Tax=Caenorhabditis nigoni TaxID=1611254 RepID=A0A2G5SI07_9PELO|nr:hypothetical protein B9Z55_026821 [Caenorhabditis nigoni]
MVSWSQFPPEIRRKIAENYDFMSRISMRNTCHVDRQIVDSTKFRIPRVRFGYKEDKCLICIYTGIEKFLRLEIQKFGSAVIIYKSENSPYLTDSIRNLIPCTSPLNEGLLILKSLLAHKSIQISTMEWELERFDAKNESFKFGKQILKLLGKSKFHVKELEVDMNSDDTFLSFYPKICDWKHVELVRKSGVSLYSENMNPVTAHDYHRIGDVVSGKPICYTYYCTHDPYADRNVFIKISYAYMIENGSDKLHWVTHREPSHLARQGNEYDGNRLDPNDEDYKLSEEYRFEEGNVCYARGTQCGVWANRYFGTHEKELKLIYDREKCGIGSLCPKHADPFDYWYYQNLPRRLVQEPLWNGFKCFFTSPEIEYFPATPDDLEILKRKIRVDENRKRKVLMENQQLNPMEYSWAFRRENLMTSEVFEISEDVVEKRESRESRWGTWLKIIFLPILISFVFYAIFY